MAASESPISPGNPGNIQFELAIAPATTPRPVFDPDELHLTDDERLVLQVITRSGPNYTGARVVAQLTGIRERGVRYIVKDLIEKHGAPIVSMDGQGGGFKLETDPASLMNHYLKYTKTARSLLFRASRLVKSGAAARACGQLDMEIRQIARQLGVDDPADEERRK